MKATLFTVDGKKHQDLSLPAQCTEPYHPDLIKRAFLAYRSTHRQPYGAYPKAGQRTSAVLSRRRRQYRGSYGHGISRVPRKALWHRGRQFGWVGAFAPGTVAGRRAHPPKPAKIFAHKINKNERKKALRSAIAATFDEQLIRQRGHRFDFLPAIVESKMEQLKKTSDVEQFLRNLKLDMELERAAIKKVRAGKGKMRNRRYKTKKGPLLVVSQPCSLLAAARNIPGVDACVVNNLNINLLAPGGQAGRLTIYSEEAVKKIEKDQLFTSKLRSAPASQKAKEKIMPAQKIPEQKKTAPSKTGAKKK